MPTPTLRSLLESLPTKARLLELARYAQVSVPASATKAQLAMTLSRSGVLAPTRVVAWMGRDELRTACAAHGLAADSRARHDLAAALLDELGAPESLPPRALSDAPVSPSGVPIVGSIALVRHRQYLVEGVREGAEPNDATAVDLVCLDDDARGKRLSVLWEVELGARVLSAEADALTAPTRIDPPRHFAAYFHALKWSQVTATRSDLFQAPFRAGIKLLDHQLTPLKKALELPRANLFIADDVGLGKTIEAGLVMSELALRQRVSFVLVICPAALCLQWRTEMERRFGQRFELMNRETMTRRRRERGFGVPVWSTHNQWIVSYQTLRRPEYREPLLAMLDGRLEKSLLVLDEAHTAAPASSSQYAIDSAVTSMIRDEVAPCFENRLFLSATPHNGHSNSFSALMAMLDPQRFTRGVPIGSGSTALGTVMVRRLKKDLLALGKSDFPTRLVMRLPVGDASSPEVQLSKLLASYRDSFKGAKRRSQLVLTNLQKRLLSSIEAFHRTLSAHAESALAPSASLPASTTKQAAWEDDSDAELLRASEDDSELGVDDDAKEDDDARAIARASRLIPDPDEHQRELLSSMLALASKHRSQPDAKVETILAWIKQHLLVGGRWNDARLIIFTEYGDTMRYLARTLDSALEDTPHAEERVAVFHGGMGEDARALLQDAFNGDPSEHRVRILVATDAAREGLNLQSHCADLFHFDVPWNPARMEQRNGRIDRTLQPSPEVRCHYFVYPDREEDAVLERLVEKVGVIQRELGSLGEVVMERVEKALARGIETTTLSELELATAPTRGVEIVKAELEANRVAKRAEKLLEREIDEARAILQRSRKVMDFHEDLLRDAIDVGLAWAGAGPLNELPSAVEGQPAYAVPELPASWERTLDSLRRPRRRDEPEWEWRKEAPQPVVFRPLDRMGESRVHLHLEHPFVQRILARFAAQGFGAEDLSRVTIVPDDRSNEPRALAIARLSLFGAGAARLHDELVLVAAPFLESEGEGHLVPQGPAEDAKALAELELLFGRAKQLPEVPPRLAQRLLGKASATFAALAPHLRDEAESKAHGAAQLLEARGNKEAADLRKILLSQRADIERELHQQLELFTDLEGEALRRARSQREAERVDMRKRLDRIEIELEQEPAALRSLFAVSLRRLTPVGLVYLWPTTSM